MTTYIKLYGVPRSCTNLVKLLLHNNFSNVTVLSNVLGWKHGNHPESVDWSGKGWDGKASSVVGKLELEVNTPDDISPLKFVDNDELKQIKKIYNEGNMNYVVCLKDPYSWIVSYSKYDTRGSFLSKSLISYYISVWNVRHRSWSKLLKNNSNATTIRYEDILKDPNSALQKISVFFNLERMGKVTMPEFSLARNPEKVGKLPEFEEKRFSRANYYLNKEYLEYFNKDDFKIIENSIDHDLVSYFGYELI